MFDFTNGIQRVSPSLSELKALYIPIYIRSLLMCHGQVTWLRREFHPMKFRKVT